MNDVSKNIREYIFTALDGNVNDAGASNVPCFSKAPPNQAYPYIIIKNISMSDNPLKDSFGGVYQINVEAHTRFNRPLGGQDDVDVISDNILALLRLRTQSSDFGSDSMYMLKQINQVYIEDEDEQFEYYTKIQTWEAHVYED